MNQLPQALVDTAFVTIYGPFSRPLSFTLLQLVVVVCGVLTFIHAFRQYRRGDGRALFAWTSIFTYGVLIELLSYNVFKNFTHGQFPVMFYHHQLPLYVSTIYPVFIYSSLQTVERFHLGRAAEPVVTGLVIVALDVPFDILGPGAGWWSWAATDPNIAYRWLDVPVTSYCWHLFFGGAIVFLCRLLSKRTRDLSGRRLWKLLLAAPVAVLTIVLGILLFIPFHVLVSLGLPDGTVVAGLLGLSLLVFALARKQDTMERDGLLLAVPVLFYGYHLLAAITFLAQGELARGPAKLTAISAAVLVGGLINVRAHRRRQPSPVLASA